jgi:hypothetical protein
MAILGRDDLTLDILRKEMSKLERQIVREAPTTEEAEQLLYATSIAVNSAEYWFVNIRKWYTVLNSTFMGPLDEVVADGSTRSHPGGIVIAPNMPEGWYPHPDDPRLFIYVDSNGVIFIMECPAGLWFNLELCSCDWPENVDPSRWSWSWMDFCGYDVAGGLVGAAVGAVLGPGAAVGALGGGATSSGVYALKKLWDRLVK